MAVNEKVIGLRQTIKMLRKKRVTRVILAEDSDSPLIGEAKAYCLEQNVPLSWEKKKTLGKVAGIELPASAIAWLTDLR